MADPLPNPDSSSDVYSVAFWNPIVSAVRERALASSRYDNLGGLGKSQWVVGHRVCKAPYDPGILGSGYMISRVGDLQYLLENISYSYIRSDAYPNGYEGLPGPGSGGDAYSEVPDFTTIFKPGKPDNPWWSPYKLAQTLGHTLTPDNEESQTSISNGTYGGPMVCWRRKMPRRITSDTDTASRDLPRTAFPGQPMGPCPTGSKAQWYDAFGRYRGVYERTAGGWQAAAIGAAADVLDSDQPWMSAGWCFPGQFQPGDYFGWWIADDLVKVCRLFKWTYLTMEGNTDPADGFGPSYHNLKSGGSSPTRAAAIAAFNASGLSRSATIIGGFYGDVYTQEMIPGSPGDPTNSRLSSAYLRVTRNFWRGASATVTHYVATSKVRLGTSQDPNTYDPQGMAVTEGQFVNFKTDVVTHDPSEPDAYERLTFDLWSGYPEPPNWNPTTVGHPHGFEVRNVVDVMKWTFAAM